MIREAITHAMAAHSTVKGQSTNSKAMSRALKAFLRKVREDISFSDHDREFANDLIVEIENS